MLPLFFQAQTHPPFLRIHRDNTNSGQVLVDREHFQWMGDPFVTQLRDVDEPVVFQTEIHKGPEIHDAPDHSGNNTSLSQHGNVGHVIPERDLRQFLPRIEAGFLQFPNNIFQGFQSNIKRFGNTSMIRRASYSNSQPITKSSANRIIKQRPFSRGLISFSNQSSST